MVSPLRETGMAARREIAARPAGRAPRRGHVSRDDSRKKAGAGRLKVRGPNLCA